MNPWWASKINNDHTPEWLFPQSRFSRSQDLPNLYCPSGALWIAKAHALRTCQSFYTPDHVFNVMDWMSAMDIDEEEDWLMAETCMLLRQRSLKHD